LTLAHRGEALNLTEVHVSRILGILRVQHVAQFFRHRLEILDAAAFTRAAGFGEDTKIFEDEPSALMNVADRDARRDRDHCAA